ncbi:MAG: PEP-CTERM sorting domain-containing protein [Akkermansiaceae bacterium]
MKNIFYIPCTLTVMGSAVSQASVTLIDDDFTSGAVTQASRFSAGKIDSGEWIKRDAAWAVSGGELTNPALDANGTNDDRGAFVLNSLGIADTTLTEVTVSFDYTVGAGSTLYFHSTLFTEGAAAPAGNISRLTRTGGAFYTTGTDFNSFFGSALNLKDGTTNTGSAGEALISFAGGTSGTFIQTYDISGYTGVSSIADVDYVLAVFAADTSALGDGAITVDNLSVVAIVPEPSTFGLLGMSLAGLLLRRHRA